MYLFSCFNFRLKRNPPIQSKFHVPFPIPCRRGSLNKVLFLFFQVTDPDVCQVRLDFLAFRMGGPSMEASPFGQCSGDRMAIFAGQNRLGLSEGNLVCGDMTDQHS